jgi:hypothetical protein
MDIPVTPTPVDRGGYVLLQSCGKWTPLIASVCARCRQSEVPLTVGPMSTLALSPAH